VSFSFYLHSKITTKILDGICLCCGSKGVFIFSFWFFFYIVIEYSRGSFVFFINKILFNLKKVVTRMSSSMVLRRHVWRCSATKLWPPWRCFNHHNIAFIPMRWVWQKYVRFCAGDLLFSSFFSFSSSVLKPTVTHYQSNLLIYFSFGFNLFFIAICFILDYPYNW